MSIPIKILIAILLGAFIGLERESYEHKTDKTPLSGLGSPGIRTYSLISLLGAIAGVLLNSFFAFSLSITICFFVITVVYYILGTLYSKDAGFTTELAILFTYILGFIIATNALPIQLTLAITVILVLILSLKEEIRSFIKTIKDYELESLIAFSIIALVVFPFLPNISYTVSSIPLLSSLLGSFGIPTKQIAHIEIVNPQSLWKIVMLITGVDIVGYFLERTIGQKKGLLITSLVGGFISSTSTTLSLAIQSKKSKNSHKLSASALFSNAASFIQHAILIASLNIALFTTGIYYILALLLSSFGIGFYFLRKADKGRKISKTSRKQIQKSQIFSLKPAIIFALLFIFIKFATKLSLVYFGKTAFVVTNMLAALTGMDAVTISVSELAGTVVPYKTAIITFIGANAVNLASKTTYSYLQGSRRFAVNFSIGAAIIVISTLLGYIFI